MRIPAPSTSLRSAQGACEAQDNKHPERSGTQSKNSEGLGRMGGKEVQITTPSTSLCSAQGAY
jgi:hypothetical protein